jgi:hypothetical protein
MTFVQDSIDFKKKLVALEVAVKDIYKIKKDLNITVSCCEFKEGSDKIIISHPDFPNIECIETDLNDIGIITNKILMDIEKKKAEKKIYELKWQIDYWMEQTNPEFIAKMLQKVEDMKAELTTLEEPKHD